MAELRAYKFSDSATTRESFAKGYPDELTFPFAGIREESTHHVARDTPFPRGKVARRLPIAGTERRNYAV